MSDRAAEWARWSLMWSRVSPLVDQQPWFQSLDAHTKAHMKEAITRSALATKHPTMPLDIFVMREMLGKGTPAQGDKSAWAEREQRRKAWVERLAVIANAAREASNAT